VSSSDQCNDSSEDCEFEVVLAGNDATKTLGDHRVVIDDRNPAPRFGSGTDFVTICHKMSQSLQSFLGPR
jgi:hypothetical protein